MSWFTFRKMWYVGRWELYFTYYLKSWKVGLVFFTRNVIGLEIQIGPVSFAITAWTKEGAKNVRMSINEIGE